MISAVDKSGKEVVLKGGELKVSSGVCWVSTYATFSITEYDPAGACMLEHSSFLFFYNLRSRHD